MASVLAYNHAFPEGKAAKLIVKTGEPLPWIPPGCEQLSGDVGDLFLASWFAMAHFHVSAFRAEGYGLWQQQCMASARIPVCPRFSAPAEFIPDAAPSIPYTLTGGGRRGDNGAWCEPDTDWLVEWMRSAAANVESYAALAGAMPGFVRDRTFDALARKLMALVD